MGKFIPPDWRDDLAYPAKADDWGVDDWAWEFLRRNPEYQKDYEHFDKLPGYNAYRGKGPKWFGQSGEWWHSADHRYCKHPILPDDDTVLEYVTRTGDSTPYYYSLEEQLMEKWGITGMQIYDPSDDEGCQGFFGNEAEPGPPKEMQCRYDDIKEAFVLYGDEDPQNKNKLILLFDLRQSISRQLKCAEKL